MESPVAVEEDLMRRADRLFQIIQLLRSDRVTTAARLAERLEVSERTVYRDIRDLVASGVPIEGEAGVGYLMGRGFELPPLMFTGEEIEALVLGARFVESWADPGLVKAADSALAKVEAVLTDRLKSRLQESALYSIRYDSSEASAEGLAWLRHAVREKRKVRFAYVREDGERSERTVRPLCLAFMAPTWMLSAWCEHRAAFRTFRVDRMESLDLLEETFPDEPGRRLEDFLRMMAARHPPMDD
jgi:predicted DNA-binding transcriptional regulator YafY